MMGRHEHGQGRLFYQFDLEEMVPADHLLRAIAHFLDPSGLREHLAPLYSHTGRPSIDPELMILMLIVGYAYGIRSERRLCEDAQLIAHSFVCHAFFGRSTQGFPLELCAITLAITRRLCPGRELGEPAPASRQTTGASLDSRT